MKLKLKQGKLHPSNQKYSIEHLIETKKAQLDRRIQSFNDDVKNIKNFTIVFEHTIESKFADIIKYVNYSQQGDQTAVYVIVNDHTSNDQIEKLIQWVTKHFKENIYWGKVHGPGSYSSMGIGLDFVLR